MIAEFDTRCRAGYAPGGEILPGGVGDLSRASGEPSATRSFAASRERFESTLAWLEGSEASGLAHGELEARLELDARELYRLLLHDHLDLRCEREQRSEQVRGADGVRRGCVEAGHRRALHLRPRAEPRCLFDS